MNQRYKWYNNIRSLYMFAKFLGKYTDRDKPIYIDCKERKHHFLQNLQVHQSSEIGYGKKNFFTKMVVFKCFTKRKHLPRKKASRLSEACRGAMALRGRPGPPKLTIPATSLTRIASLIFIDRLVQISFQPNNLRQTTPPN